MSPAPEVARSGDAVRPDKWAARVVAAIFVVMVFLLRAEGRRWWCACGKLNIWAGDVWSSHCSQHLLDPYSITHVAHGLIFWGLLAWLAPRWPKAWRFAMIIGIAATWEVVENSTWVIERYRTQTMSLDYLGDSIINSIGDVACCAIGVFIARAIGLYRTIALVVAMELLMMFWIRDNLTLNVIMLVHPIKAIKQWQSAGHVPTPK